MGTKSFAVFTTKGGAVTVDNAAGEVNFSSTVDADGYVVKGDALNAYANNGKTRDPRRPDAGDGELLVRVGAGGAGAKLYHDH